MIVRCSNICSLYSEIAEIMPQRNPLLHRPVCPDPGQAWNCLMRGKHDMSAEDAPKNRLSFFVLSLDNEQDCWRFKQSRSTDRGCW